MTRFVAEDHMYCTIRTGYLYLPGIGECEIQVNPDLLYPPRFNVVRCCDEYNICSICLDRPEYSVGSPVLTADQKDILIETINPIWMKTFSTWIDMSDVDPFGNELNMNVFIPDSVPDYSKLPDRSDGEIRIWTHPLFNLDGLSNTICAYIVLTDSYNVYLDIGFRKKTCYHWMTVSIDETPRYIGKHHRISAEDKKNLNSFLDKYWAKIRNTIIAEFTYPCKWYDCVKDIKIMESHPDFTKLGKTNKGNTSS